MATKRIPSTIASIAFLRDENLRRILDALRIDVETLYRERGDRNDSAVLVKELKAAGLIDFDGSGTMYGKTLPTTSGFNDEADSVPTTPAWSTVMGKQSQNLMRLTWAYPTYRYWAATEVWIDDSAAFASPTLYTVVTAPGQVVDVPVAFYEEEMFVKVRFKGTNGKTGAYSPLAAHVMDTLDATAGIATGTHALTETLPDNCQVTHGWYNVGTTFTSATDAATIGLGIATDDATGIKAAIAINNAANPWDAGTGKATDQDGTAGNFTTQTTAARAVQVVVGSENLTAGVLNLYLFYVVV